MIIELNGNLDQIKIGDILKREHIQGNLASF